MKNLTATLCLTIAVLLGTFGPAESRPLTGVDVSRWVILYAWVNARDFENPFINLSQQDGIYPASFKTREECNNVILKRHLSDGVKIKKDQRSLKLVWANYPASVAQISCVRVQLDELPFQRQ